MTQSPSSKRPNLFRRAMPLMALALSAGLAAAPAWAQAPRSGTSIGNQATATYSDGSQIERSVQSNSVTTTVQQVAGVDLTANRNISAAPGAPIAFPHTVENTVNGVDSFDLAVAELTGTNDNFDIGAANKIYADANQDGIPDNTTLITRTPSLQPGEKFNFVVVGTVPSTATAAQTGKIDVTATSVFAPGTVAPNRDLNTDTVTVSNNAVINVTKSVSGPVNGVYTYTLRYTNNSNVDASDVTLTDALDGRLVYQSASGRWSQTGTDPLNDDTGDNDGQVGPDIDYSVSGQTVTAIIASVKARDTGAVSFQVAIDGGTAPGRIPNTANFRYDDDGPAGPNGLTPQRPTNTVELNVAPVAGVAINDNTQPTANQGATVTFTNIVTNGGTDSDTFDITIVPNSSTFPAGTVFQLFQTGGAATLLDSNGNGIPDTGPIAPNGTYSVVVKAILPANSSAYPAPDANGNNGPFQVQVRATSVRSAATTDTGTDTVTTVTRASVDLTNFPTGGRTDDTQTYAGNPGIVVRIPLSVENTSLANDNYALTLGALPEGFSVVFRDENNQVITNTGNVAPDVFFDYFADVTIPANAASQNVNLTFTVTSGASGATDTVSDVLTVTAARALTVAPNNQGQVFPGSSVNYAHTVTNNGNVTENNIAVSTADTLAGFSSVLYADSNANGILDGTEGQTPLTTIGSLAPGANFPVIVVVFGPSNQFTSGAVNTTTLSATTGSVTINGEAVPGQTVTATDTTTIVAGDVTLTKSQSVNGGTATQGNLTAAPGATITYTILVRNTGGAAVTGIEVRDTTPAFTTYTTTPAAAAFTKSDGTSGVGTVNGNAITWNVGTLEPGATATVTFNVKIDG